MNDYNLSRMNFLIVDDNKHMRKLVEGILRSLGVKTCVEAADGAGAFRELRHYPTDVIICDWNMSPLDGLDFTRMVRTGRDSPNPFVPIIMLTGHTEMNRVVEARDAGVNEFLAKPISAHALYTKISSIIEFPRQFIRSKDFFGPDRRRHENPSYSGPERRTTGGVLAGPGGNEVELSQEEVEALLNG